MTQHKLLHNKMCITYMVKVTNDNNMQFKECTLMFKNHFHKQLILFGVITVGTLVANMKTVHILHLPS